MFKILLRYAVIIVAGVVMLTVSGFTFLQIGSAASPVKSPVHHAHLTPKVVASPPAAKPVVKPVAPPPPPPPDPWGGGLSNIPGVPASFVSCVAWRESTNLQNPAANGNAYGIIPASGYNVYGTSLHYQKMIFKQLYVQYGGSPWAADGCPGT